MAGMDDTRALYKIRYAPAVKNQLNNLTEVRPWIKRQSPSGPATGQFTREPLLTGQTGGEGCYGPEQPIPEADTPEVVNTDVYIQEWWGSVSVSQRAISASKNNEGAYVRLMAFHVSDLRNKAMFAFERMVCGNGTGFLASVGLLSSQSGNNTVTAGDTKLRISKNQAARIRKRERVEFWTNNLSTATKYANPASQDYYRVVSVNQNFSATQAEITFDPPLAFGLTLDGSNLQIVKDGARTRSGGTTYTNEPYGLDALIDNSDTNRMQPNVVGSDVAPVASSLQNLTASGTPEWSSAVKPAASQDFSPQLCEDVFSELASFGAMGREGIRFIGVHPIQTAIWRKGRYPEQRIMVSRTENGPALFPTGTPGSVQNGKSYMTYSNIPIVEDRMFADDTSYFVATEAIRYNVLEEFQAWDPDGGGPHRNFSRKSALDQEFFLMEQLFTNARNMNAKATGMSTTL